jgi:hypothetical protein
MKRNLYMIDEEEEKDESEVCFSNIKNTIKFGWVRWIEYLYGIEKEK